MLPADIKTVQSRLHGIMHTRFLLVLVLVLLSYSGQPNSSINVEGKIVGIVDGDTIDCLVNFKKVRVRLHAIDAPERKQDYYNRSKQALSRLCYGKQARLVEHGHDRYRRLIADVYVNKEHINYKMVELGMAWHFRKYSTDKRLAAIEKAARDNKTGLWSLQAPIAPWEYRMIKKHVKFS